MESEDSMKMSVFKLTKKIVYTDLQREQKKKNWGFCDAK